MLHGRENEHQGKREGEREIEEIKKEGKEMEKALSAITLFDTIIFVTENNAQKPRRNREVGWYIHSDTDNARERFICMPVPRLFSP